MNDEAIGLPRAAAIILAGGKSGRMGCDKALLPFRGQPALHWLVDCLRPYFSEVLISANDPDKYAFLEVPVIADKVPGQGPLMGIASSIEASPHDVNFVIACDSLDVHIPFVRDMLCRTAEWDCVVPVHANGFLEPLYAVYRRNMLDALWETLRAGERRVRAVYSRCRTCYVPLPREMSLENVNTPDDFEKLESGGGAKRWRRTP